MSDPSEQKKPFGLKQITLVSIDGLTAVILPAALELGFEEIVVSAEFPGNDELQGIVTQPQGIKGAFKQGGFPLAAIALMTGHSLTTDGTTPNQIATLDADSSSYPYFKIYGKSLGDEKDDVHMLIKKAKLSSSLKGSFKRGEFFLLDGEFTGVKVDGSAYETVAHETAAELPGATGSPSALTVTPVPADAATNIAIDDPITLTFNNAIKHGSENGIILTTQAGVPVTCTRTINGTRKVVTLTPDEDLDNSEDYLIIVPGVKDIYDQVLADTVVDFSTVAP